MSLYRQAGGPNAGAVVVALAVGLLVGGLTGFLAGKGSAGDPSLAEQVADARAELSPVAAGLELVPVEYGNSVRSGRVVEPTEYEATKAAVDRAEAALTAPGAELRAIDPAGYAAAVESMRLLANAVEAREPAPRVESLAQVAKSKADSLAND